MVDVAETSAIVVVCWLKEFSMVINVLLPIEVIELGFVVSFVDVNLAVAVVVVVYDDAVVVVSVIVVVDVDVDVDAADNLVVVDVADDGVVVAFKDVVDCLKISAEKSDYCTCGKLVFKIYIKTALHSQIAPLKPVFGSSLINAGSMSPSNLSLTAFPDSHT